MRERIDIKFQYYDGNITHAKPLGFVYVRQFINAHRYPTEQMREVFSKIAKATNDGDIELKKKLKQEHLYYFTPAAIFKGRRRYKNIVSFTGLAQLDFDNVERAVALKQYLFDEYRQIVCCYLSPSGQGVKALIKIKNTNSVSSFRRYYAGLRDEFEGIDGFDESPKNIALPLFLSIDEDILFREDFTTWTKKGKVMEEKDYSNLIITPPEAIVDLDYFKRITIEIFKEKINGIIDSDGHPRLRNACLVLGSRVGAGYLSHNEAFIIAEYETKINSYLQKGISGYLKTVKWAIDQGIGSPRYYAKKL